MDLASLSDPALSDNSNYRRIPVEAADIPETEMIPVAAVISSTNRAPGIFWRISAMSLPIHS
jgi:hypothetical protein